MYADVRIRVYMVHTMAAMLVPMHAIQHVSYKDGSIDVGLTMYKVYQSLGPNQRALELGGGTFSLSNEMRLAREEVLEDQRHREMELVGNLGQLG